MKLHLAFSIFFIGFSGCVLASQLPLGEINEDAASRSRGMTTKSHEPASVLSVHLYLPLTDDPAWSSIMAQSQLTVTPTVTITVNNILVTSHSTVDGSCGSVFNTFTIGSTSASTFTLTGGHPYSTTDASNFALATAGEASYTTYDTRMQFRNGTTNVGSSVCIPGSGACTDASNCGWGSPQTWSP